jgi:hypothetical protein
MPAVLDMGFAFWRTFANRIFTIAHQVNQRASKRRVKLNGPNGNGLAHGYHVNDEVARVA